MALKECIRALARGKEANVRYRNDSLTRMLKNSLDPGTEDEGDSDSGKVRVVVIATVSPASKDTEHTVATLSNACVMDGSSGAADGGEMSAEARAASRASIFNSVGGGRGSVSCGSGNAMSRSYSLQTLTSTSVHPGRHGARCRRSRRMLLLH